MMVNGSQIHPPLRAIRAFVWDLADEGLEDVLERLRQAGVDGLNLALAYHGGRFYCPHNPRRVMVHAPDGVLYFQPLLSCYEQIRPPVHPEFSSGAFVARIGEAVREFGMHWSAWLALLTNRNISWAHPECTCVNALGDRLDGALCPANPAVRTYAQALVEDVAHRVGVDSIELEDFAFPSQEAYMGGKWRGVPIGPELDYLLSLCFCEHCRHRAEEDNIEVDDLMHRVERMIRSALEGDLTERRIADEISDPYHPLTRFAGVRGEIVTSLLEDLQLAAHEAGEVTGGHRVDLRVILAEEPDENWRWGVQPNAIRRRMVGVTVDTAVAHQATRLLMHAHRHGFEACDENLLVRRNGHEWSIDQAFVRRYVELLDVDHDLVADVSLSQLTYLDGRALSATVEACEDVGVDRFVFSHYGLAPLDSLEWIGSLARP